MKKVIVVLLALVFVCAGNADASKKGKKGASDKAYEKANENARFKRDPDWFPKGKSDAEKELDKAQKIAEKEARKAEKESRKQVKMAERESKKAMDKSEHKMKKGPKKKSSNK